MDISYSNDDIRRLVCSENLLKKDFNVQVAKKVVRYVAMLKSAQSLSDLSRQGRVHKLNHDLKDMFSLSVGGGVRLIFEPDHDPIPRSNTTIA